MKKAPTEATIAVRRHDGETDGQAMARICVGPQFRHGILTHSYGLSWCASSGEKPALMDCADLIEATGDNAANGDLTFASRLLTAQALSLDAMFTELSRRAAMNFGQHLEAGERYARLALKAQAGCRATLDSLARLHQPREQTVRHVHVNEGGQAIVAEAFHHHAGGAQNGKSDEQSHATEAAIAGTAVPCSDTIRDAVPVTSSSRA